MKTPALHAYSVLLYSYSHIFPRFRAQHGTFATLLVGRFLLYANTRHGTSYLFKIARGVSLEILKKYKVLCKVNPEVRSYLSLIHC